VVQNAKRPPKPKLPRDPSAPWWDREGIDPEEVARQLTLYEWDIYEKIKPWELLHNAWMKGNKEERAPNVHAFITRFNYISNWIATTICTIEDRSKRVKAVKRALDVAEVRSCYLFF